MLDKVVCITGEARHRLSAQRVGVEKKINTPSGLAEYVMNQLKGGEPKALKCSCQTSPLTLEAPLIPPPPEIRTPTQSHRITSNGQKREP